MDYFAYIGGKTHNLVQGFTVSEEYNETLDSANIIISDSEQLNLNPYDDVFIFSEYCGYFDIDKNRIIPNYNKKFVFKGYPVSEPLYKGNEMPFFYKHFLLDQFNEEMIILGDSILTTRYKYKVDLFSETKGLETIQAPNISITQPLGNDKTSTVTYVNQFLKLYNNKVKTASGLENIKYWNFDNKYKAPVEDRKKIIAFKNISETEVFISDNEFLVVKELNGIVENAEEILEEKYDELELIKLENHKYFKPISISEPLKINGDYQDARICCKSYNHPTLLETFESVFEKSYCPDFSLNNPSLRQILEKLAISKDCIPVVRDDEIFVMDITKRRGNFDLDLGQINYITGSKSSDNYCTDLKRTYSDGLGQENSTRFVDYMGFRNSDAALLTLDNLRVETKFPIYKINKMYMCYYKKIGYVDDNGNKTDKVFLCKQDITPLVKLNSERNVLSEDIDEFRFTSKSTVYDLAKFKISTVGYDIGSNYITGWGTKYNYPKSFTWQNEIESYIETIFKFMNSRYKYGIYNFDYLTKKISGSDEPEGEFLNYTSIKDSIVSPNYSYFLEEFPGKVYSWAADKIDDLNITLYLKNLFFQIDYQGFYSGTVVNSKGLTKNNITINDNQSSSLALLEIDGLNQKEKLDRYGNKGIQINARYKEVGDIQGLGTVYEHNNDNDVVIFHKQYSINSNVINCTYYGSKDYVLKNYFTSVYARHRTYNLMSYSESVERSENEKMYIIFSKNKKIINREPTVYFSYFDNFDIAENQDILFLKKFLSFYEGMKEMNYENENKAKKDKINYGTFYNEFKTVTTDINVFISGNSLCLNGSMSDNINVGTYIEKMKSGYIIGNTDTYFVGSTQKWANIVGEGNLKDGKIESMLFGFSNIVFEEDIVLNAENFDANKIYGELYNLPIINQRRETKNNINFFKFLYKDNKERINMTLQFEPIVDEEIFLSPWVSKLSDLFSTYNKYNNDINYSQKLVDKIFSTPIYTTLSSGVSTNLPILILIINKQDKDNIVERVNEIQLDGEFALNESFWAYSNRNDIIRKLNCRFEKTTFFDGNTIELQGVVTYEYGRREEELKIKIIRERKMKFSSTNLWKYDLASNNFIDIYQTVKDNFVHQFGIPNDFDVYMGFVSDENSEIFDNKEIDYYGGNGNYYWTDNGFDELSKLEAYTGETIDIKKKQNLFWVRSHQGYKMRSYMVYDILDSLDEFQVLNVKDEIFEENDIKIEWTDEGDMAFKHGVLDYDSYIMFYYKTLDKEDEEAGKYNFVFGFKVDKGTDTTKINISLTSFKDLTVYDRNTHLPLGEL